MWDQLSNGDLLRHLVVQILTVEDHGLQDGQGALQHGCVHGRLVHVAGNLQTTARPRGIAPLHEKVGKGPLASEKKLSKGESSDPYEARTVYT